MRSLLSVLALGTTLAAQYVGEPPVLITDPPIQDAQFNGTALGAAGPVASIQFTPMRDASGTIVPNQFYICATIISGAQYLPHAAIWDASTNTITPKPGDVASFVGTGTGFAMNVSHDLLVGVFDVAGGSAPIVATRPNATVPFGTPVPIGAPVPAGYRDSMIFDQVAANQYQYGWLEAAPNRSIRYATIDVTTGAVLSAVTTCFSSAATDVHSQMAMRQWTGLPADIGRTRAMYFSNNTSSADCWFRSSIVDDSVIPLPGFNVYGASTNWCANPGHRGGNVYYAFAATGYIDPLKLETVTCSSAQVPLGGGLATLVGWAPPGTNPKIGVFILGSLGASGIDLSFLGVKGKLGLNPAALVFLPALTFDPVYGEVEIDIGVTINRPTTIHQQLLMFDIVANKLYLGNTAQTDIR